MKLLTMAKVKKKNKEFNLHFTIHALSFQGPLCFYGRELLSEPCTLPSRTVWFRYDLGICHRLPAFWRKILHISEILNIY